MHVRFAIALTILLAGCVSQPAQPPSSSSASETESPAPTESTPSIIETPTPESVALSFLAEGCVGIQSGTEYLLQGPGNPPTPSWTLDTPIQISVQTYVWECERFSWGKFERPVKFAYDLHNKMVIPEGCRFGPGPLSMWALNTFITNDSEVGAYLHTTYGIPVVVGEISWTIESGPMTTYEWILDTPIGTTTIRILDDDSDQDVPLDPERIFWQNPLGGISMMQLRQTLHGPYLTTRAGTGQFEEPMLDAYGPQPVLLPQASMFVSPGRMTADLAIWRDANCEQPA